MAVLHAPWVVKMELNERLATDGVTDGREPGQAAETPQSEFMREYGSRRCHICQCRHPPFGFGPPLTKPGQTLWACVAHRDEVNRLLTPRVVSPVEADEPKLL